ncbi:13550_t:CDS:1, partial [Funneliformis caledonium]
MTQREFTIHNEVDSLFIQEQESHQLLTTYELSLISELITPKEKKRNNNKVPRPPNCFIIFRNYFVITNKDQCDQEKISMRMISTLASEAWKSLSPDSKSFFRTLADMYLQNHKIKYPDYKFSPKKKRSSKSSAKKEKRTSDETKEMIKKHMFTWNINERQTVNDPPHPTPPA